MKIRLPLITETTFPDLTLLRRGKVRDVYDLGDALLLVATDRLSAFDVVMPNPIPCKGAVLTTISHFWFRLMSSVCTNHVISNNVDDFPSVCKPYERELQGRSMLVRKTIPFPIECVVRGYLSGSGWKEYQRDRKICAIPLPAGLQESSQLPEPIFTPATKAEAGHDENISFDQAADIIGMETATRLKEISISLYERAREYALQQGIIIADTKFEFGVADGEIIFIDEALTPDSSRFWRVDQYEPGRAQPSFDKQFVRDYLESIQWNKQPPAPILPDEVVQKTSEKYIAAFERLTGEAFPYQ